MERRVAIEQALAHMPLMLNIDQTCEVLSIGRSLAYAQARRYLTTAGREGIPAVRIGGALRIPRTALVEMLLATPPPAVTEGTALHAVAELEPSTTTTRHSTRPRLRRARSARQSTATATVAQLPFASPD
jgi:hypothetical protein